MTAAPTPVPVVVLVHGAWHGAWCFAALQAELDRLGIASLAVDLPGHGVSLEPLGDLLGDAAHVTAVLERLPGPVVLVGHSYGGAVISQAGTTPNVAHLVYLAAFVVDVDETVISLSQTVPDVGGSLGAAMIVGDGVSTIDPTQARDVFYGHCDPLVSGASAARLSPQPYATFVQPATAAAWRTAPSTYVRCTDDRAIPLALQDVMAARCSRTETLATDHSPFSSLPVETAGIIAGIAREVGP